MPGPTPDDLRAKYADWCSAQMAERLLALSDDELWRRTRPSEPSDDAPPPASPEAAGASSSADHPQPPLSERLILSLREELALPEFDDWAAAYREDPEPFERVLLGFRRQGRGGEDARSVA